MNFSLRKKCLLVIRNSCYTLFFVLVGIFLFCCDNINAQHTKKAQSDNILRFDVGAPLGSLDISEGKKSGYLNFYPLLYSYMFVPNNAYLLEPDLATDWSYNPSDFTWIIQIRENALFHDGQRVTTEDIKYSLELILSSTRSPLFSIIDNITTESMLVKITLKKNDPEFLKKIWGVYIIPKHKKGDIHHYNYSIGSGPFRFSYRKGNSELGLVANENYFGGRPSIDKIIFYYEPDREKAWSKLLSADVDIIEDIYPKDYASISQYQDKFHMIRKMSHYYTILLYNTTHPLFSDPDVRTALSYAINKEYIVKKILHNFGEVAATPLGVTSEYHNPEVKPIPYNPQKGLELLERSGWSYDKNSHYFYKGGNRFEFTILVFEKSETDKRIAEYLQLCLNDFGIKVNIQSSSYGEVVRRYRSNNEFEAVLTEFKGAFIDLEILYQLWTPYAGMKSEAGCFEDPRITRLLRETEREVDPERKKNLFYQIDVLFARLQPGTFLFQRAASDVISKRVKLPFPFSLTLNGVYRLKYASIGP